MAVATPTNCPSRVFCSPVTTPVMSKLCRMSSQLSFAGSEGVVRSAAGSVAAGAVASAAGAEVGNDTPPLAIESVRSPGASSDVPAPAEASAGPPPEGWLAGAGAADEPAMASSMRSDSFAP